MPLGSLLGPLEALLRGLCSLKPLKTNWSFRVFANAGFWFFEACDGSFGLILAPLGKLGSKMDPKMGSKSVSKSDQKLIQK